MYLKCKPPSVTGQAAAKLVSGKFNIGIGKEAGIDGTSRPVSIVCLHKYHQF
ncbi:MAG TPA: hypothetical protein ACHBX0_13900 [Arsenophonus sp.]